MLCNCVSVSGKWCESLCSFAAPIGSAQEVPSSLKFTLFVGNTDMRWVIVKEQTESKSNSLFIGCHTGLLVVVLVMCMKMMERQWTTWMLNIPTPPFLLPTKSSSNVNRSVETYSQYSCMYNCPTFLRSVLDVTIGKTQGNFRGQPTQRNYQISVPSFWPGINTHLYLCTYMLACSM